MLETEALQPVEEVTEEGFPLHETWEHASHYEHEQTFLLLRNGMVTLAAILFVLSLTSIGNSYLFKAVAYFCGAVAYGAEIMVLTDGLRRKEPLKEMYMPYVFSCLYVVLGISYFVH